MISLTLSAPSIRVRSSLRGDIAKGVPRNGATYNFLQGVAELVEAADPKALAKKIEELSHNQIKLDELAKLGSEFAKKHLDPEVGRAKYLRWVEGLIQNK